MKSETIASRVFDHYAATGDINASYVARTLYESGQAKKSATLAFRHGREEDGQAVQLEVTISSHFKTTTRTESASVSFGPALWSALVQFVERSRSVRRTTYAERQSMSPQSLVRLGLPFDADAADDVESFSRDISTVRLALESRLDALNDTSEHQPAAIAKARDALAAFSRIMKGL
jgi:hypothetical protein